MAAVAEARAQLAFGDRLAHQELLAASARPRRRYSTAAVVASLEAIDPPHLAASGQRRVEDFGALAGAFLVLRVEDLEIVAVRRRGAGNRRRSRRCGSAPRPSAAAGRASARSRRGCRRAGRRRSSSSSLVLAVVLGLRGVRLGSRSTGGGDRHEDAAVVHRGDPLDAALAEQDHAHDLARARPGAGPARAGCAIRCPSTSAAVFGRPPSAVDDAADLVLGGAVCLAAPPRSASLRFRATSRSSNRLRRRAARACAQRRHVLRDDAHLDRVERRLDRLAESERVRQRIRLAQRPRQEELRPAAAGPAGARLRPAVRRSSSIWAATSSSLERAALARPWPRRGRA